MKKCSNCGTTPVSAKEKGTRLGCPKCYNIFRDFITEALDACQFSLKHTGKRPKDWGLNEQLGGLERKLKRAIAEEKYEEAAKIKAEIDKLKSP